MAIVALAAAGVVVAQAPSRDRGDPRSIAGQRPAVSLDAADAARLNAQNVTEQVREQLAQLEEDTQFAPGQRGL